MYSPATTTPSSFIDQSPVSPSTTSAASNTVLSLAYASPSKEATEDAEQSLDVLLPQDEALKQVDATKHEANDDKEMEKNLLNMLSKSQERKRKPRTLPNLKGVSTPRSPTKPESPLHAEPETLQMQEHAIHTSSMKNDGSPVGTSVSKNPAGNPHLEPELSLSPTTAESSNSLRTSPTSSGWKSDDLLPLSPMESLQPVHESSEEHLIKRPLSLSPLGEETGNLKWASAVTTLQPPSSLIGTATISTGSLVADGGPEYTSETMMQEDASSSSDFEARNVVSLELEMERKKGGQPISSDDLVEGSGNSIGSDMSLPVALGRVTGANAYLEGVATSLPDLNEEYQTGQR
jgi:hypothetical protein